MNQEFTITAPAQILLVEDNPDDVYLTREGLKNTIHPVELSHVSNGEECLAFLRKQGEYFSAPRPDLILLDLNMPVMDGRETLREITSDPALCHLPIVMLTTSPSSLDCQEIYQLRCNSYIVKPLDFREFQQAVGQICDYWFSLAKLPRDL